MSILNTRNSKGGKTSSIATRIIRDTLRQGGKIDEDVFKKIVRAQLDEKMAGSSAGYGNNAFTGMIGGGKEIKRSKNAQKAIDQMNEIAKAKAARKASKEVIVVAKNLVNGRIDAKGRIKDISGNLVGTINKKTGAMTSVTGFYFGIYKPKSTDVNNKIIEMIDKNSPYLINMRRNILLQKQQEEAALRNSIDTPSAMWMDVWGNNSYSNTLTDVWGNKPTNVWGNPM